MSATARACHGFLGNMRRVSFECRSTTATSALSTTATKTRRHASTIRKGQSPLRVLGVTAKTSFAQVRQAFVKLAMEKHPDKSGNSHEEFILIRQAFEYVKSRHTGNSSDPIGNIDKRNADHDDDIHWSETVSFYSGETTTTTTTSVDHMPFKMTEETRREIIEVYNTMERGGNDKGGYWDMARKMAEEDERTPNRPIAGTEIEAGPSLRRKRR